MTKDKAQGMFQIDPKVSMGHILTFLGMVIAGAGAFYAVKGEVSDVDHESRIRDMQLQNQIEKNTTLLDLHIRAADQVKR